jgi:hypothetical protein
MYEKYVERANPGCIIFLVDQSYSMTDGISGTSRPKCEVVTVAINRFISEMITICEKGEEKPRHYFDVAVVGYTTDKTNHPIIGPVLGGALAGRDLVSIVDLYDNPLEVETRQKDDGAGGLVEFKLPVWYRTPAAEHMAGTPMCGVLQHCRRIAADWCAAHPNSFPPVVIHLTDGESSDGDPEGAAEELRSLSTSDGNLLLFNCHLSDRDAESVLFPTSESQLPDDYGRMLFRMSSPLPEPQLRMAEVKNLKAARGARGMAFNADSTKMLLLIGVGTVVATPQMLR